MTPQAPDNLTSGKGESEIKLSLGKVYPILVTLSWALMTTAHPGFAL